MPNEVSRRMSTIGQPKVKAPALLFKMEQIGGEWVTRQVTYLSKTEVAALLHISPRTVYDFINRSENPLPHLKIPGGRELLFRLEEVERWLDGDKSV